MCIKMSFYTEVVNLDTKIVNEVKTELSRTEPVKEVELQTKDIIMVYYLLLIILGLMSQESI